MIITYKHGIYQLPDELQNELRCRIFEEQEISEKCLNFLEKYVGAESNYM